MSKYENISPEYTVYFNGNSIGGNVVPSISKSRSFGSWTLSGAGNLSGVTYTFGNGNATIVGGYANDDIIQLPTISPQISYYSFAGWYTQAEGGTFVGTSGARINTSKYNGQTLYAHWIDKVTTDTISPEIISLTEENTGSSLNTYTNLVGVTIDRDSGISGYQFSTDSNLTASSAGWIIIDRTNEQLTL